MPTPDTRADDPTKPIPAASFTYDDMFAMLRRGCVAARA